MDESRLAMMPDLCRIVIETTGAQRTLEEMVRHVARTMGVDACSLHALAEDEGYLTLQAAGGRSEEAAGRVGTRAAAGLMGMVLEQQDPVFVVHPKKHPRYEPLVEEGCEDVFQTFLGASLVYESRVLGVLVIRTVAEDAISQADVRMFSSAAAQIATILGYTDLMEDSRKETRKQWPHRRMTEDVRGPRRKRERSSLRGVPVSPGFGEGHAQFLGETIGFDLIQERLAIDTTLEMTRIDDALARARGEIKRLGQKIKGLSQQDQSILDAQLMYLEDASFKEKVLARIREGYCAEYALKKAVMEHVDYFEQLGDPYLRERALDVEDMGKGLLRNLLGLEEFPEVFARDTILVASDIAVRELIRYRQKNLKGIVLSRGGKTAHATILAKSFEIPMVIGLSDVVESVKEGDFLIVDGRSGRVFRRPIQGFLEAYDRLKAERGQELQQLEAIKCLRAMTRDGYEVRIGANVGLLSDLDLTAEYGADHIGLYRTEFPFLERKQLPSEEEQVEMYRDMVLGAAGLSVTIRTLDVGGDKFLSYLDNPKEKNPALGWRSIRISLETDGVFRTQVRAVMRASAFGKVKILFPMISSVDEVKRISSILEEEKRLLERQGVPFDPDMPSGIMVEVPGTVRILDKLLRYVDFASIGTNDLIQYTLAVDRSNQKVSALYNPLHPAVISTVFDAVCTCKKMNKEVSICGETTSLPPCAYLFLGMGVDRLSMNSASIPTIKQMIRSVSLADARKDLMNVLGMESSEEIRRFLEGVLPPIPVSWHIPQEFM